MKLDKVSNIYFLGIGGIGMSALARYFMANKKNVAGFDRTATPLTHQLTEEGAFIHYEDNPNLIPDVFLLNQNTLVIYTPAIPKLNAELNFFKNHQFSMLKRSQVLGLLSTEKNCIAVAGTHGKTTVSSITAHLLNNSIVGCSAFLGGITTNYNSNLILNGKSNNLVVEADEFDRSFLQLYPNLAVITSMDADHLDIYSNHQNLYNSFQEFVNQIHKEGILILKLGLENKVKSQGSCYTYSLSESSASFYIKNLQLIDGTYHFSIIGPDLQIDELSIGMAGKINVENALAATAAAFLSGAKPHEIKNALATFKGVKRRMEIVLKQNDFIYIDDYAHHPEELKQSIQSVKALYPNKAICGIFQPHLFSRTRDFADEFAESLSLLDHLILLEIYPAREEPIPGIDSTFLLNKIKIKNKVLLQKNELIPFLKDNKPEVLMSLGAGDIDRFVEKIKLEFEC